MNKKLDSVGLARVWERMKTYVANQQAKLDFTLFKVVTALPTSDIDSTKIYLVPSTTTGDENIYTEYIYVNSAWEIIGQYKANIDLTPYVQFTDLATADKAGAMSAEDKTKLNAYPAYSDVQAAINSNTLAIEFDTTTGLLTAVTGADDTTFSDGALDEETGELQLEFQYK